MKSLGRKKSSPLSLFDDGNSCDSALKLHIAQLDRNEMFERRLCSCVTIISCHSPELIFSRGSLCLLTSFLPAAAFPLMSPPASSVLREGERGHSQMTFQLGKSPKSKE